MGVSFTRYDALYGIAAGESRIDMEQDKVQSRGEWRVNGAGIEAIRYWFGKSDYQHREIENATGEARLAVPQQGVRGARRGAAPARQDRVRRAARRHRHAVRPAQDVGAQLSKPADLLLDPARDQQRGCLPVRGTAGHQAAQAAGGRAHRADGREGVGLDLVAPNARLAACRGALVRALQRQRGLPLSAADGHRRATDRPVRRARAGGRRAVLQGRARGDRDVRDRQSVPDQGEGPDLRARLQEGDGRVALRYVGLLHQVRRVHLQAGR